MSTASAEVAENTDGYVFNHVMLRVKDPDVSLAFYRRVFGMELLHKREMPAGRFTLYFLARTQGDTVPEDPEQRRSYTNARQGVLELTHNWGTEDDPDAQYHNGNDEPQGYGHICFTVPDLDAAVAWMDANDVTFQKRPEDGSMKNIAFVRDPDGYWIELVAR
ncbi:MAG TPA: lactoylglutathione lyase [Salinisphaeraceae bacterium]|nr:lactoylglutathione lyase [Salinisphaeraceae bacterium]